jgi:hypothetical protein
VVPLVVLGPVRTRIVHQYNNTRRPRYMGMGLDYEYEYVPSLAPRPRDTQSEVKKDRVKE